MKRLLLIFLLCSFLTSAQTLSGTLYDSNLNQVSTALVQISTPKQINVVTNGTYHFDVSSGTYEIQVAALINGKNLTYTDNITVESSDVTYDIILIENQLHDSELNELSQSLSENDLLSYQKPTENNTYDYLPFALLLIIAIATVITIFTLKKKQKPTITPIKPTAIHSEPLILEKSDEYKQEILNLLDKQGGAASQKELRNQLPWSEARVSIELSELEKQGKIKRVKTGRANLIKKT